MHLMLDNIKYMASCIILFCATDADHRGFWRIYSHTPFLCSTDNVSEGVLTFHTRLVTEWTLFFLAHSRRLHIHRDYLHRLLSTYLKFRGSLPFHFIFFLLHSTGTGPSSEKEYTIRCRAARWAQAARALLDPTGRYPCLEGRPLTGESSGTRV